MDVDYQQWLFCPVTQMLSVRAHGHLCLLFGSVWVCVNRRAAQEACIYRNTWVQYRYLIGLLDYLAEDSTAHVLFSSLFLCGFIKAFFCCCCCHLLCNFCKLVSIKTGQRCRSVRGQAACQQVTVKSCGCGSVTANTLYVEVCRGPDSSWIPVCVPLMCITRHLWYLIKWVLWDRMSLIFIWNIFKISHREHQFWRKFFFFFNGKLLLRLYYIQYILAIMHYVQKFPQECGKNVNKHELIQCRI